MKRRPIKGTIPGPVFIGIDAQADCESVVTFAPRTEEPELLILLYPILDKLSIAVKFIRHRLILYEIVRYGFRVPGPSRIPVKRLWTSIDVMLSRATVCTSHIIPVSRSGIGLRAVLDSVGITSAVGAVHYTLPRVAESTALSK